MKKIRVALVASICALSMLGGVASADPLDGVCEDFPGPRDGKAIWYHAVCR